MPNDALIRALAALSGNPPAAPRDATRVAGKKKPKFPKNTASISARTEAGDKLTALREEEARRQRAEGELRMNPLASGAWLGMQANPLYGYAGLAAGAAHVGKDVATGEADGGTALDAALLAAPFAAGKVGRLMGRGAASSASTAARDLRSTTAIENDTRGAMGLGDARNNDVLQLTDALRRDAGLSGIGMPRVKKVDAERARSMAKTYEGLPTNDPEARSAYEALNTEVAKQLKAIQDAGYRIEYVDADPYKSSADMMADVRDNRRLKVFKTPNDSFHPYFTPEQNDAFRAVHDFLAHAGEGHQFGPTGEENAYRVHASTLSGLARRALATETRGQNSWVNYGPNAHLPAPERPFAEQKAALWPEHLTGDYHEMDLPNATRAAGDSVLSKGAQAMGAATPYEGPRTHGSLFGIEQGGRVPQAGVRVKQQPVDEFGQPLPNAPRTAMDSTAAAAGKIRRLPKAPAAPKKPAYTPVAKEAAIQRAIDMLFPDPSTRPASAWPQRHPASAAEFAVVTPENPGGVTADPKVNAGRQAAFDRSLSRRGLSQLPVVGQYTDGTSGATLTEGGSFIPGIGPAEAAQLGRQFGQNSVLTRQGLHDLTDNVLYPSNGITETTGLPQTKLPNGRAFDANLDFGAGKPVTRNPAPGLTALANTGPYILTPPSSGTVFNESNLGRVTPSGISLDRAPTVYPDPSTVDWPLMDRIAQHVRTKFTPDARRGARENPRSLGWYDTSEMRDGFQSLLGSEQGLKDFQMAMRLTSPPSAGTQVFPKNLRYGSYGYYLYKNGMTPDQLRAGGLVLPEGYKHRYQGNVNDGWARIIEHGNLDPIKQPKTYRHGEQPALGKWGSMVLDRHVGYRTGVPGVFADGKLGTGYPASWKYGKPADAGDPFSVGGIHQRIDTSPADAMYPLIEDPFLEEAHRMGVTPPQYLGAGWTVQPGVDDPRTLIELYNEMFRRTGALHGITPLEAFKRWAQGSIPLWGAAGAAAGLPKVTDQQAPNGPTRPTP